MASVHDSAKEYKHDQNALGKCVDKFHQDENNEMKIQYVAISIARSSVTKNGYLKWNLPVSLGYSEPTSVN